jgi:hypothetical protein
MVCVFFEPVLKAVKSTEGMGNLPLQASCVAAIKPMVAAGNTINAKAAPMNGTCDTKETKAMNMKNKPPRANGCLKNVLIPSLTQAIPVRAGTTFNEMLEEGDAG